MIQLVPMNDADFQAYLAVAIPDYAQEHVQSGRWSAEEALQRAQQEYQQLLPDGLQSKNQYFYTLHDTQSATSNVGMLWFAVEERAKEVTAFVYDIIIYEQFRRRGYGEQAFLAMESIAREFGAKHIKLHVFAHNAAARALYEKLGYAPTNIMMSKPLT